MRTCGKHKRQPDGLPFDHTTHWANPCERAAAAARHDRPCRGPAEPWRRVPARRKAPLVAKVPSMMPLRSPAPLPGIGRHVYPASGAFFERYRQPGWFASMAKESRYGGLGRPDIRYRRCRRRRATQEATGPAACRTASGGTGHSEAAGGGNGLARRPAGVVALGCI